MTVSEHTKAVLLLTAHLSKESAGDARPLTPTEWGAFARWLHGQKRSPELLLRGDLEELLAGWQHRKVTLDRVRALLSRGSALALALDKWLRAGIWVLTRSEPDYPARLRQRLKDSAPPLLFGCGKRALLANPSIAVVGSRSADEEDLGFSRALGARAAESGYAVVSGGARGVDEAAMLGALSADGTAIGVLADSLIRKASSASFRKHILAGDLALVSQVHPEAAFSRGNAMARNKYVYCLSDAAIVVHSGTKGGTWNGARENLKQQWGVPLWVKRSRDPNAGNEKIVSEGGSWLEGRPDDLDLNQLSLAREVAITEDIGSAAQVRDAATAAQPTEDVSFYDLFLLKVAHLCRDTPRSQTDLMKKLGLTKGQISKWLGQAVRDKKLDRVERSKRVRYQWRHESGEQMGIFGD